MTASRRGFLAGAAILPLAGCGFRPVYMPTASGQPGPATRDLAAINVGLMPDRPGQVMREALQERLASDSGAPVLYDLGVNVNFAADPLAIRPDNLATRVRVIGRASYVLNSRTVPPVQLISGNAHAIDNYNLINQQFFAADLENQAVTRRIIQELADQITTQLAIFFRKRAGV